MQIFLLIVQLLPAIIAAIKAVEEAIPLSGAGKAKTEAVLGMITDTVAGVSGAIPQITAVIARIVVLFNATGIFQKGQPA